MKKSQLNSFIDRLVNQKENMNDCFIQMTNGTYNNELFGIEFDFPNDWFIANLNDIINAAKNQKLVGEYEYHKDVLNFIELPALLITKYDPNDDSIYGVVSPTINFNIIPKHPDYVEYSLKQYADLIEEVEVFGYHPLNKFQVLEKENVETISGYDSVLYRTEYLFEHEDIDFGIMVQMNVLNIDYGDFFIDFSMTDSVEQNQIEQTVFDKAIESIKLKY